MGFCSISACDSSPNLVTQYLKEFNVIDSGTCTIILVLPKYACQECTRKTFEWMASNSDETTWVITDDIKFEGLPQVIIETEEDKIVQYNPYVNMVYFTLFKDGVFIKTKPISIKDLDNVGQIFNGLKSEC